MCLSLFLPLLCPHARYGKQASLSSVLWDSAHGIDFFFSHSANAQCSPKIDHHVAQAFPSRPAQPLGATGNAAGATVSYPDITNSNAPISPRRWPTHFTDEETEDKEVEMLARERGTV